MRNHTETIPNSNEKQFFYPNNMGRVVLLAMEEILGRGGVNAILNLAALSQYIQDYPPYNQDLEIPFTHISLLQAKLESAYGPRAGRGLAMRVGRACFKYGLREFAPELGLTNQSFRLLPLQTKIKTGSEAFAGLFNNYTDQRVSLEMDEKYIFWQMQRCPLCWGRQTEDPCCHLEVGLLQEALFWVSGGKYFEVEEKKCIACGDSECTIRIARTPIG
jgi:predicted hydrocarbon binding protein